MAFCKRSVTMIAASSAMTHLALSLCFFWDRRGGLAFFLTFNYMGELGMLLQREEVDMWVAANTACHNVLPTCEGQEMGHLVPKVGEGHGWGVSYMRRFYMAVAIP